MKTPISATQAACSFSDLLNHVRECGEEFLIERDGEPIGILSPVKPPTHTVADLVALLRSLPTPDPAFWDEVEAATRQYPVGYQPSGARDSAHCPGPAQLALLLDRSGRAVCWYHPESDRLLPPPRRRPLCLLDRCAPTHRYASRL